MKTIFIIFLSIFICCDDEELKPQQIPGVALYSEKGTWDKSVTALKQMFGWMNIEVTLIDAKYVNNNTLDSFKIICFPGGNMFQYSQNISKEGLDKIKIFIKNGGGYIGICGGAYFSAEKIIWQGNQLQMNSLGIFEGTANGSNDSIVPYPQWGMSDITITDTLHPVLQNISKYQRILYYWGPVLTTNNTEIQILGKYDSVGLPAILAFEYGKGKVFITGTHPEIEEDSDRDGVVFTDTIINGTHYYGEEELEDMGSDWIMMKNVVDWLLSK